MRRLVCVINRDLIIIKNYTAKLANRSDILRKPSIRIDVTEIFRWVLLEEVVFKRPH